MKLRETLALAGITVALVAVNAASLLRQHRARQSATLAVERGPVLFSINRASAAELERLPGIGPVLAERIVQYRARAGGFRSLEELKRVKGIGDKTFARIAAHLVL